ncbi:MAG: DinB family protein [Bacteroidetes bacterium]|nr:MAG: DinB family protein [Bacteroidota bacterium]
MYIPILVDLFLRDLTKLEAEISLYNDEKKLWAVGGSITNSAGNLTLHICGNLQHFIGAIIGKSGYVRNRDLEFSAKNIMRGDLLMELAKTKAIVETTLKNMHDEDLSQIYPVEKAGKEMNTAYMLNHLYGHLQYHLGQINYHRRLLGE